MQTSWLYPYRPFGREKRGTDAEGPEGQDTE